MTPDVSVCMPAHRDSPLLRRALQSALEQTHDDLEVVVSDDSGGSLEPAVAAAADPRIRYFRNPEQLGFARNHTTTVDRAEGRFIAFLHDDDRWLPGYLEQSRRRFDADRSLGMVCTAYWLEREGDRLEPLPHPPPPGRHVDWLPLAIRHHTFIPSSTVLTRGLWEDVRRPWPEVVIGDLVLWIDAAVRGWPMYWESEPAVIYRYHADQISANEEDFRNADVAVFESYRFPNPEWERLRRERLAHAHIARAGIRLRVGEVADAREDLRTARRLAPARQRPRRIALSALARSPAALPLARAARAALRRDRGPTSAQPGASGRPAERVTRFEPGAGANADRE
ncbi:MAG: glycosyltransferase family 2 protein [Solirubrobacterales bacterium]